MLRNCNVTTCPLGQTQPDMHHMPVERLAMCKVLGPLLSF